MISALRALTRDLQQRMHERRCHERAQIGDQFRLELPGRIENESGDPSRIQIGHSCHLGGTLRTSPLGSLRIGSYCWISDGAQLAAATSIVIGDYVGSARGVYIVDNNNHPIEPDARREHRRRVAPGGAGYPSIGSAWDLSDRSPIVIEDNVWIGMFAYIGKGVRIGEGAVVARQAVVTKDVEPYTVVAGNPAVIVKRLPLDTPTIPSPPGEQHPAERL